MQTKIQGITLENLKKFGVARTRQNTYRLRIFKKQCVVWGHNFDYINNVQRLLVANS